MASVRIVLTLVNSIGERTDTSGVTIVALIRNPSYLLIGPAPPRNVRGVDAMLVCVPAAGDLPIPEFLLGMHANGLKFGNAVDGVNRKTEAVGLVVDRELHWRIDVAFFLVAAHVQVLVVGAPVGQPVDQPRVSVKIEDDRFISGEQGVKVLVRKSVRMLRAGLEFEKVDHVNEPDLDVGEFL